MRLKDFLPWVCVLGLLGALVPLYSTNQKQAAELAQLRQPTQEPPKPAAEDATNNPAQTENEELARLRKENEDLLRLRNEVGQLRADKQQLAGQLQKAQSQAATAQEQAQTAQEQARSAQVQFQTAAAQAQTQAQARIAADKVILQCQANLRQIEAAKEKWALANNRPKGWLPSGNDLLPYLPGNALPVCPAGGVYTINPIGVNPICSIPGHALPQ
jgi:hypothetical protein